MLEVKGKQVRLGSVAPDDIPIVRERVDNAELNVVMSNSFGFGGTNGSLVLQRYAA